MTYTGVNMALINCRECGAPVSDNATKCPSCGCNIPNINTVKQNRGCFMAFVWGVIIILLIIVIAAII
jgi:hypothetical protein